jgi:ATP synthase protein I
VIARVGAVDPKAVMLAAVFTYVVKVIALGIVLVLMPADGPIDTRWMAGAIALGVFGWLAAHMRYVWTLKIFYVDPG